MQYQHSKRFWRVVAFALLAGAAAFVAGCSGKPILQSPVTRTLNLPAALRERSEERKLRKAVEADNFPRANAQGL